ncbi:MAG TPA: hypothetical protein VGN64_11705, partial [Dyadobacter sp.]|nr:hypothetical protein [Dyadobacter sp.]
PLFRQEAELMTLLLHAYTLQLDSRQLTKIKQLAESNPDNLLLHFFATTTLMKEARSGEAGRILDEVPSGPSYIAFPFLDYLRGEIALQSGDYDKAFSYYSKFQSLYKGFNYIKDSNLKMFMCRWLAGRDTEAKPFIEKIKLEGSAIIEADKLAVRVADDYTSGKLTATQKVLYKSRYATDGGFLSQAVSFLSDVTEASFNSMPDKAEFNYRKGRILQKSDKEDAALPYFQRCVNLTKGYPIGFGASSALQLGYIYKEKKQKAKAIEYFKVAMAYKKYEYKNSIDSKARAALTSLGV